jgi:hypothetical protein
MGVTRPAEENGGPGEPTSPVSRGRCSSHARQAVSANRATIHRNVGDLGINEGLAQGLQGREGCFFVEPTNRPYSATAAASLRTALLVADTSSASSLTRQEPSALALSQATHAD